MRWIGHGHVTGRRAVVKLDHVEIIRPHPPEALVAGVDDADPAVVVESRQGNAEPGALLRPEPDVIQGTSTFAGQVELGPALCNMPADVLLSLSVVDGKSL